MTWNSGTIYALGLHRTMARIIGIWPVNYNNFASKIRIAFVTVVPVWMCIDFTRHFLVKGYCGSITETVDVTTIIIMGITIVIKMIVIIIYQDNLLRIVNSAVKDWAEVVSQKCRSVMLRYAYISRTVVIIAIIGLYIATVHLIFSRLRSSTYLWDIVSNSSVQVHGVPIWPSCWIPTDISTSLYTVNFIVQSVMLFVVNISYCVYDIVFLGVAMHLCGQFQVLYDNLEHLHDTVNPTHHRREVTKFIKRHSNLLTLANDFEQTFRFIILTDIGTAVLFICISGVVLLMTLQSSDFVATAAMVIRICLVYIQLFTYNYIGEQLNSQTDKLRVAIYNCPWYTMSPDVVRNMMIIMMRCNYPFNLTAGKIYNVNIATFMNIFKTITSYFSIIRLMFENDI